MTLLFALIGLSFAPDPTAAIDLFRQGVEARGDVVKAQVLFRQTAEATDSPLLRGKAYFLAGDLPRSIAAFHAGLRRSAADPELRTGLTLARAAVLYPPGTAPEPPAGVRHRVGGWHLLIASVGCLVPIAAGLARRRVWLVFIGGAGWLVLAGVTVEIERERIADRRDPVRVLGRAAVPRCGNADAFPPRLDAPLPAGAEVRVRLERGGWTQVTWPGGGVGWVPADALLPWPAGGG